MFFHSTHKVHQHTDVTNKLSRKKMEIYVMKKKFVLTLALVLMVAVTLTAAKPLEVSGSFKAGYKFTFDAAKTAPTVVKDHKATIDASFTGDFWKVSITGTPTYGADKGVEATAEIYLDKALKEEGVDMGDVSLTLHAGTSVAKGAYTQLADLADFREDIGVAMDTADNFGLTVGYADLVKVFFAAFPGTGFPMVVGATVNPLDGVAVSAGFSNDWTMDGAIAPAKALTASAKVDVKKLADLDFGLTATGEYLLDVDNKVSLINADVAGDYEGIGLWVAYNTDLTLHKLATKASYKTEIDNFTVGAGVKFSSTDLADIANKYEIDIDASASYKLGGATYALALGYGVKAEKFTVSPTVAISF
jgi:hypothetical protein